MEAAQHGSLGNLFRPTGHTYLTSSSCRRVRHKLWSISTVLWFWPHSGRKKDYNATTISHLHTFLYNCFKATTTLLAVLESNGNGRGTIKTCNSDSKISTILNPDLATVRMWDLLTIPRNQQFLRNRTSMCFSGPLKITCVQKTGENKPTLSTSKHISKHIANQQNMYQMKTMIILKIYTLNPPRMYCRSLVIPNIIWRSLSGTLTYAIVLEGILAGGIGKYAPKALDP